MVAFIALWQLAWRGLWRRPVRSWLTALSVAVAAASLTTVLALGAGLRLTVAQQIGSIGPQLQLSGTDLLQSFAPPPILPERLGREVNAFREPLGLLSVTPVLLGSEGVAADRVTLYGVPAQAGLQVIYPRVRMGAGQMLRAADEGQPVAVLGAAVARKRQATVGDRVRVGHSFLRVVGVLAPTATLTDGFLVVPLQTLQHVMRVPNRISLVAVQVADEQAVPEVALQLSAALKVEAQTQSDFREVTRRLLTISGVVQLALALVALTVGALCVLNTVSMSVLERQAEFAALRAMGTRPGWLLRLVVLESVLLSVLGAGSGLVLGTLATLGIGLLTRRAFGVRAAILTPPVILEVLLACMLIGLLAGLPSGWRVGRRSILSALSVR